ncbi:MAG TPA: discoidin domain-containing protein [Polyangiaceae bacterium]
MNAASFEREGIKKGQASVVLAKIVGKQSRLRRSLRSLLLFFWMHDRLASAVRWQFSPGKPGWSEFAGARSLGDAAAQLREMGLSGTAALVLYRAAASFAMRSHLVRADAPSARYDSIWKQFRASPSGIRVLAALRKSELENVVDQLGSVNDADIIALKPRQVRRAIRALAKFMALAMAPLEKESKVARRVLLQRWLRLGLLAAVPLIVVIAKAYQRPNLALHKKVTAEVLDTKITPIPGALVDGNRKKLGVHLTNAPMPYLTIDLGKVQRVTRVVVYNRSDCCKEQAVPLGVELSPDLSRFLLVGHQKAPFVRWQVDFPTSDARYIRITLGKPGTLQLAEVEVY